MTVWNSLHMPRFRLNIFRHIFGTVCSALTVKENHNADRKKQTKII